MTAKPRYRLVIGTTKPISSATLKFGVGQVRIEVSDDYPQAKEVMTSLVDIHWGNLLRKVLTYWETHPGCKLTEPPDRPLKAEVARLGALRELREQVKP